MGDRPVVTEGAEEDGRRPQDFALLWPFKEEERERALMRVTGSPSSQEETLQEDEDGVIAPSSWKCRLVLERTNSTSSWGMMGNIDDDVTRLLLVVTRLLLMVE